MKTKQFLSVALAAIALASSCKKDDYRNQPGSNGSEVKFSSSIVGQPATKASGKQWDANDEIGVFMKQGTGLSNVLSSNKKYVTSGNGNFEATGDDVINYPESGAVDFIAYYPYAAAVADNALSIDVSNQADLAKIDVMYSDNAKNLTKESGVANLEFAHKLAKIDLNVTAGTGVASLTGLTTVFNAVNTTSTLDLASGTVAEGAKAANVSAKVTAATNGQTVEAILIPGAYANKEVVFTIGANTFTWTLPAETTYESGKKYTYNISLREAVTGPQVVVSGQATITDWIAVSGGSVNVIKDKTNPTIKPEPEPGNGKVETIYLETFGDLKKGDGARYRFNTYTGFSAQGVKYADLDPKDGDIRRTNMIEAHAWLPANKTSGFIVRGIKAAGYKDLQLSFDAASNAGKQPVNAIEIKVNGITHRASGELGDQNKFSNHKISGIAAADDIVLEISSSSTLNKRGYRIDNIKLEGTK